MIDDIDTVPAAVRRPVVWTIAGTDSGGGAGLHADTRALAAFQVHGACAVAAVTAQHSRAVTRVEPVSATMLHAQLQALADDMPPAAIKTGLLGSVENLRVVVEWVRRLRERSPDRPVPLVVDPVLAATTGASFADAALLAAYRDELLPLATLATPNAAEARMLAAPAVSSDPRALARAWRAFGARAVVVTGGDDEEASTGRGLRHSSGEDHPRESAGNAGGTWANDWLDSDHGLACRGWLGLPRIATPHQHGTGCVFAASAAAALAHGFVAADAAVLAKMATTAALRHGYAAGSGAGPVAPHAGFATTLANLPFLADSRTKRLPPAFAPLPAHTLGLYPIVDSAAWVARVLDVGVGLIQLRVKNLPPDVLVREIRSAVARARAAGALLFVNDYWELALELGAQGVHLGQDDLDGVDFAALRHAGVHVGISTHSYWEVCRARALQPSYIACGPIHATTLKKMPWRPQGEGNLAYWSRLLVDTPVVAVGGMDAQRARCAMRAGASAVAAVGAVTRAAAPQAAIAELCNAVEAGVGDARRHGPVDAPAFARSTLGTSGRGE